MNQIEITSMKTTLGEFEIGTIGKTLCLFDFKYRKSIPRIKKRLADLLDAEYVERENELQEQVRSEIKEYLEGERKKFTIPLTIAGTEFQKNVWEELQNIPYGKTISYLELAEKIGSPKAVRAVGGANGQNAIALIIPCHRVINANGDLHGYGGGIANKKRLLKLENSTSEAIEKWF